MSAGTRQSAKLKSLWSILIVQFFSVPGELTFSSRDVSQRQKFSTSFAEAAVDPTWARKIFTIDATYLTIHTLYRAWRSASRNLFRSSNLLFFGPPQLRVHEKELRGAKVFICGGDTPGGIVFRFSASSIGRRRKTLISMPGRTSSQCYM